MQPASHQQQAASQPGSQPASQLAAWLRVELDPAVAERTAAPLCLDMTPIAGYNVFAAFLVPLTPPRRWHNALFLPLSPWLLLLSVLMLSQGGGEGAALINCIGSCSGRGACRRVSAVQAGGGAYRCVCTDGYHGADCSRPPSPDLSRPAVRQSPIRGGQSSWWLAAADRPRARHELESTYPIKREVEWRLPVGCDFSGFFVEVLAVA